MNKPSKLSHHSTRGSIFSFGGGKRKRWLFLGNRTTTKEDEEITDRTKRIRARPPIRVTKSHQIKRRDIRHEKNHARIKEEIAEAMHSNRQMGVIRSLHELTQVLDGEAQI